MIKISFDIDEFIISNKIFEFFVVVIEIMNKFTFEARISLHKFFDLFYSIHAKNKTNFEEKLLLKLRYR